MKLSEAINAFMVSRHARGLTAKTIGFYEYTLGSFAATQQPGVGLDDLQVSDLELFIAGLYAKDLSRHTVDAHVRGLKIFWNWTAKRFHVQNLALDVQRPKKRRGEPPKVISVEDFKRMVSACGNDYAGIRNRALLYFFMNTGCRLNGVVTLTVDNLNINHGSAYVFEKGEHWRYAYFGTSTGQALWRWLSVRPGSGRNVFTSLRAGFEDSGLTHSGIQQTLRRLSERAGATGNTNPHSFRHRYAIEYLRGGGDVRLLQGILDHAEITQTMRYTYLNEDDKKEAHGKVDVLDRVLGAPIVTHRRHTV